MSRKSDKVLLVEKKNEFDKLSSELSKLLKHDDRLEVLVGKHMLYFDSNIDVDNDKVVVHNVTIAEISKYLPDLPIEEILKEEDVINEYKRRFDKDVVIKDEVKKKVGWI